MIQLLLKQFWYVPVVIAIGAYVWFVSHQRDEARQALVDYKFEVSIATAKQQAEYNLKVNQANAKMIEASTVADNLKIELNLNREQSKQAIEALYEKINADRNVIANKLRKAVSDPVDVPAAPGVQQGSTESGGECDAAITQYETLEKACQLTTIDFNNCRAALDADTAIYGRQDD